MGGKQEVGNPVSIFIYSWYLPWQRKACENIYTARAKPRGRTILAVVVGHRTVYVKGCGGNSELKY